MRNAFGENFIFVNFETPSKYIASMKGVVETCIQKSAVKMLKCDCCHKKKILKETPKNNKILCSDCYKLKRAEKVACKLCNSKFNWVNCFNKEESFNE